MIITYRFVRRKYKERQQRRAAETTTSQPAVVEQQETQAEEIQPKSVHHDAQAAQQPTKKGMSWTWRLMIMGALAIPIFLETLDYTGAQLICLITWRI